MKKKLVLLISGFTLVLMLTSAVAFAQSGTQTGQLEGCYAQLGEYGGDTRGGAGHYIYYEEKNTVIFKCLGTTDFPPNEPVKMTGASEGYPYYYWKTCAVDWLFGWWDGTCGTSATGETYNWTIKVFPDGTWRMTAKAKDFN